LSLTGVIDLFSRHVVRWSMRDNMQTSAVTFALRMARFGAQQQELQQDAIKRRLAQTRSKILAGCG